MPKSKLINIKEFKEILNNLSPDYQVRVYDVDKKRRSKLVNKPKEKNKYTLNQLGIRIDQIGDALFEFIKVTNDNFKQVNARIDNLEKDVKDLKQDVRHINIRLDYIVQANNLKDLSKNK